jgi:hypothetical protein
MKTKPNDKAYPSPNNDGLTKREYFAAMALQGILANEGSNHCLTNAEEAIYEADRLIEGLNR